MANSNLTRANQRCLGPERPLQRCGARTRRGTPCQKPPLDGKTRCRLHGGLSTGPRTAEGRARIAAAINNGVYDSGDPIMADTGSALFAIARNIDGIGNAISEKDYNAYDPDNDGSAFIDIANGLHRIGAALEVCGQQQTYQVEVLRDISETLG
jgi:hypothetical protein